MIHIELCSAVHKKWCIKKSHLVRNNLLHQPIACPMEMSNRPAVAAEQTKYQESAVREVGMMCHNRSSFQHGYVRFVWSYLLSSLAIFVKFATNTLVRRPVRRTVRCPPWVSTVSLCPSVDWALVAGAVRSWTLPKPPNKGIRSFAFSSRFGFTRARRDDDRSRHQGEYYIYIYYGWRD